MIFILFAIYIFFISIFFFMLSSSLFEYSVIWIILRVNKFYSVKYPSFKEEYFLSAKKCVVLGKTRLLNGWGQQVREENKYKHTKHLCFVLTACQHRSRQGGDKSQSSL